MLICPQIAIPCKLRFPMALLGRRYPATDVSFLASRDTGDVSKSHGSGFDLQEMTRMHAWIEFLPVQLVLGAVIASGLTAFLRRLAFAIFRVAKADQRFWRRSSRNHACSG